MARHVVAEPENSRPASRHRPLGRRACRSPGRRSGRRRSWRPIGPRARHRDRPVRRLPLRSTNVGARWRTDAPGSCCWRSRQDRVPSGTRIASARAPRLRSRHRKRADGSCAAAPFQAMRTGERDARGLRFRSPPRGVEIRHRTSRLVVGNSRRSRRGTGRSRTSVPSSAVALFRKRLHVRSLREGIHRSSDGSSWARNRKFHSVYRQKP